MNPASFSSKLNTAIHGQNFDPTTQITAEDIAKCKGSSHSIMSRVYHQIKTRMSKGQFVTNKMVDSLLANRKSGEIEQAFAESLTSKGRSVKQLSKDRKLGADIAKIFSKRLDKNFAEGATEMGNLHEVLKTLQIVEKYDPEELLRAAAYEIATHKKGDNVFGDKDISGIKGEFISFINSEYEGMVTNKLELEDAYNEFIKTKITSLKDQQVALMTTQKTKLEGYRKNDPVKDYRLAQSNHDSGFFKDDTVVNYKTMSLDKLLEIFNPPLQSEESRTKWDSTQSMKSSDETASTDTWDRSRSIKTSESTLMDKEEGSLDSKEDSWDTERIEKQEFGQESNTSSEGPVDDTKSNTSKEG